MVETPCYRQKCREQKETIVLIHNISQNDCKPWRFSLGAAGKENIMGQDPNKMTVEELSAAAKEGNFVTIYAGVAEWEKQECQEN